MRVAFDLWGTLVKPNPLLQEVKKNLITQNIVDQLKVNVQDFLDAMDATKCNMNGYMITTGCQPTDFAIISSILHHLQLPISGNDNRSIITDFLYDYNHVSELFPPVFYDEHTLDYLNMFLEDADEVMIISNTMFLKGNEGLRGLVNKLNSNIRWMFSDCKQYCKPHKNIYYSVEDKIDLMIGDTPETDGKYAEAIDARFYLINNRLTHNTILDAYDYFKSL